MAFVTVHNDVIFIEGEHPRARLVQSAETRVGGFGAQLKNLTDLKQMMANHARQLGCNCVVRFTYGQKSKVIAIDDVAFVGNGVYALLSVEDYNSIRRQLG